MRAFLRARHDDTTLAELVETKDHDFGGVGHARLRPAVAGLDVYGTYAKASFAASGDLVSVVENLVSTSRALRPSQVGPDAALRAVLARYYPGAAADLREVETVGNVSRFERRDPFSEAPTVTRVALPTRGAVLDSGYLVVTWDRDNVLRHTARVGARADCARGTAHEHRQLPHLSQNHPGVPPQTLVNGPGQRTASPNGWVTHDTTTIGNNVDAYLDRDNNNVADANSRPVSATQQSSTSSGTAPSRRPTLTNQRAAVTNLFYLNNVVHDRLYGYGFTESGGQLPDQQLRPRRRRQRPRQRRSPGRRRHQQRELRARRATAAGRACRCTSGTVANPDRDGDLDSDIVYHEYGHGLTWRMIGNMAGALAGAIGEGMSDTVAIYINGDDRVGEYSTN